MKRMQRFTLIPGLLGRLSCVLALCMAGMAAAQQALPVPGMLQATQQWIDAALKDASATDAQPLRMQVSLGQLDSRLRLAPCARIEPYLPAGTRLWGRTRIGLRCLEGGTRWNVFLPVTVQAFGSAWVLRAPVGAGTTLRPEDAMQAEVDWASEASTVLADPARWQGQLAAYPLSAGQALRQAMVRPAQVFQAGATIRILAQGPGFSISSDGQALSNGVVGQMARVRTESGREISGLVLDSHTVKVTL